MRFNKKTKRFIGAVLLVAAVLLVFSLLVNKEEDYDRTFTTWTVGAINDSDGIYDGTVEGTMVSSLIEVNDGIKIVPNFTSGVSYILYGYNEDQGFVAEYSAFNGVHDATFVIDELEGIHYIRIVMTPDDDNGKITELEKLIYATQLEIYTKTTNNK